MSVSYCRFLIISSLLTRCKKIRAAAHRRPYKNLCAVVLKTMLHESYLVVLSTRKVAVKDAVICF